MKKIDGTKKRMFLYGKHVQTIGGKFACVLRSSKNSSIDQIFRFKMSETKENAGCLNFLFPNHVFYV